MNQYNELNTHTQHAHTMLFSNALCLLNVYCSAYSRPSQQVRRNKYHNNESAHTSTHTHQIIQNAAWINKNVIVFLLLCSTKKKFIQMKLTAKEITIRTRVIFFCYCSLNSWLCFCIVYELMAGDVDYWQWGRPKIFIERFCSNVCAGLICEPKQLRWIVYEATLHTSTMPPQIRIDATDQNSFWYAFFAVMTGCGQF